MKAAQNRQKEDWDKVEELLGAVEGVSLARQRVGKAVDGQLSDLPIHVAIRCRAPASVTCKLMMFHKDGCSEVGADGLQPLQLTCKVPWEEHEETDATEITKCLLGFCPDAASAADDNDDLPLHLAIKHNAPNAMVQLLVQRFPKACMHTNCDGQLPLEILDRAQTLNFSLERVQRSTGRAKAELQQLESNEAKLEMELQALRQATRYLVARDSSVMQDLRRESGLRVALRRLDWSAVLEFDLATPAECKKESGNWLPLHYACMSFLLVVAADEQRLDTIGMRVIGAIVEACPEACWATNANSEFPLQIVFGSVVEHRQLLDANMHVWMHVEQLLTYLTDRMPNGLDTKDDGGRTLRDVAKAQGDPDIREWAKIYKAFLGRYVVSSGPDLYKTRTAKVQFARDEKMNRDVCLKHMKSRDDFEGEISARVVDGQLIGDDASIVRVLGWHTPKEMPFSLRGFSCSACTVHTDIDSEYPFVVVMDQGQRSLHDECAKERIAGYAWQQVRRIFKNVAACVQTIHMAGRIHGDLKQRNILRRVHNCKQSDLRDWMLCDLDASVGVGEPIGKKTSSAYVPPELALHLFSNHPTPKAALSFDVWSLGVILFELCSGHALFAQDTNNDELVEAADRIRLCTWLTISDSELDPVLNRCLLDDASGLTSSIVNDAKDLIRWCLKGKPAERPTIHELLQHRFMCPGDGIILSPKLTMRYFAFLSHCQADASSTAATLFHEFKKLGLHVWLDVKQEELTLTGMKRGIRDSSIFLLVLTERVLASKFCQLEIQYAIEEGKPIQLVIEEDARFHPFNVTEWDDSGRPAELLLHKQQLPRDICQMIAQELPGAVTYRRRDYEQDAMMRELCRRNGIALPIMKRAIGEMDALLVLVVCNPETSNMMLNELKRTLQGIVEFTEDSERVASEGGAALLLLTSGILSPPCLERVQNMIPQAPHGSPNSYVAVDNIVAMYAPDSWHFGCPEQVSAPPEVQAFLNDHEAITYRSKSAGSSHEFAAMIDQLISKLGLSSQINHTLEEALVTPIAGVRDSLTAAERRLVHTEEACKQQVASLLQQQEKQRKSTQLLNVTQKETIASIRAEMARYEAEKDQIIVKQSATIAKQQVRLAEQQAQLTTMQLHLFDTQLPTGTQLLLTSSFSELSSDVHPGKYRVTGFTKKKRGGNEHILKIGSLQKVFKLKGMAGWSVAPQLAEGEPLEPNLVIEPEPEPRSVVQNVSHDMTDEV
eukprot:COSAG02_NODE_528_length_20698_cov_6.231710_10_plen_1229_part_00